MSWYTISAKPQSVPLKGTLRNNEGYVYLEVDSRLFAPFVNMIDDEMVVHPREVTESDKDVGAHVTVMKTHETDTLSVDEIGDEFEFFVEGLESVKPDGWDEVKKVYFITVSSPDLESLRKKYNLPPKIQDHEFHITVGVEKNASTKVASLIDNVMVVQATGSSLVLLIGGKRYEYSGVPGTYWNGEITRWKAWRNKRAAGEKLSILIRNMDRYRVKQ